MCTLQYIWPIVILLSHNICNSGYYSIFNRDMIDCCVTIKTMRVAVGSKNPVKVEAVRLGFQAVWPERAWDVEGVDVASDVSNQPMSIQESIRGARNRARKAMTALHADFGVGLEGGIFAEGEFFFDGGWMVILDKDGREGVGSTVQMVVPKKMMELINEGKELGEVNDIIFKQDNSKHAGGHFGLMTNNAITRTEGYKDGIIVALARFVHPHLF
jgi:inosine/xanthosine triphosphatase